MRAVLGLLLGVVWLALPSHAARAQGAPAGRVKTLAGQAWRTDPAGQRSALEVGSAVASGDTLETGPDGSVGITFRDETRLSLGPASHVTIDAFLFEPERDELSFAAHIARGTLLYVSGVIARLAPERVEVTTPDGTVGVRGTTFVVRAGARPERRWRW
jgi:hypothetical protein